MRATTDARYRDIAFLLRMYGKRAGSSGNRVIHLRAVERMTLASFNVAVASLKWSGHLTAAFHTLRVLSTPAPSAARLSRNETTGRS
jgi:hypothetical protein